MFMKTKELDLNISDLEIIEDFYTLAIAAKDEDLDVENKYIKDQVYSNEDFSELNFSDMIFENCRFLECSFRKSGFVDVLFKSCDFSNSDFNEGYFSRVHFILSKGVGADFFKSIIKDTLIKDSNFKYANFDLTSFDYVILNENDFTNAGFSECKIRKLDINLCKFVMTNFFKTSLKGLDFSDSFIDGIILSDNFSEIKGAKVSEMQAMELAKLLGIIIV